jgi:hypothetical protein
MQLRDLVVERLEVLSRYPEITAADAEAFLSAAFDRQWLSEFPILPVHYTDFAELHAYLQGMADAMDVTVLTLLEDLDIDLSLFAGSRRPRRRRR